MSFYRLFDDDYLTYMMDTHIVFEILITKFELFDITLEIKEDLLKCTTVYENKKEIKMTENLKFDHFLMWKFYEKSFIFINDLINNYKEEKVNEISVDTLYEQFSLINKEFKINNFEFSLIIQRVFNVHENTVDLETFFKFFNNKKSFKIKIVDFLEISLNVFITIYSAIEKRMLTLFESSDNLKEGVINFKQFREIMNKLMNNEDNKWMISDYFK
jgi:hypothetical protein